VWGLRPRHDSSGHSSFLIGVHRPQGVPWNLGWLCTCGGHTSLYGWGREAASLEHLQELDDVGVGGEPAQGLDLAQVVHLHTPGSRSGKEHAPEHKRPTAPQPWLSLGSHHMAAHSRQMFPTVDFLSTEGMVGPTQPGRCQGASSSAGVSASLLSRFRTSARGISNSGITFQGPGYCLFSAPPPPDKGASVGTRNRASLSVHLMQL
jgi:hypothetical protein